MDRRAWAQDVPLLGIPATGIGSMPGEDMAESLRLVLGELPDLPFLPELPARGAGSALLGRSAGMLVHLPVELRPAGWTLVERPSPEGERARSRLSADLDLLEEYTQGFRGAFKVAVCGPLTLAAGLERPRGPRALGDPGARKELAESLAEGLAQHIAAVRRRIPGASLIVQLDEPSLPAALRGSIPTPSGMGRLPAIEEQEAQAILGQLTAVIRAAGAAPVIHCCASGAPIALFRKVGAAGIAVDLATIGRREDDELAESVEAGLVLFLGVIPTEPGPLDSMIAGFGDPGGPAPAESSSPAPRTPVSSSRGTSLRAGGAAGFSVAGGQGRPGPRQLRPVSVADAQLEPVMLADLVRARWRRWGFDVEKLGGHVVLTPACGLAGATPTRTRAVFEALREATRMLSVAPEG